MSRTMNVVGARAAIGRAAETFAATGLPCSLLPANACPSENCPLNPLISCRLTASTMLKPMSITIRALYAPNHRLSTSGMSSTTAMSAIGTGRFALRKSYHPERAVARAAASPMSRAPGASGASRMSVSDLLDDMLAEQPRGLDEQDGDEQHE